MAQYYLYAAGFHLENLELLVGSHPSRAVAEVTE